MLRGDIDWERKYCSVSSLTREYQCYTNGFSRSVCCNVDESYHRDKGYNLIKHRWVMSDKINLSRLNWAVSALKNLFAYYDSLVYASYWQFRMGNFRKRLMVILVKHQSWNIDDSKQMGKCSMRNLHVLEFKVVCS